MGKNLSFCTFLGLFQGFRKKIIAPNTVEVYGFTANWSVARIPLPPLCGPPSPRGKVFFAGLRVAIKDTVTTNSSTSKVKDYFLSLALLVLHRLRNITQKYKLGSENACLFKPPMLLCNRIVGVLYHIISIM